MVLYFIGLVFSSSTLLAGIIYKIVRRHATFKGIDWSVGHVAQCYRAVAARCGLPRCVQSQRASQASRTRLRWGVLGTPKTSTALLSFDGVPLLVYSPCGHVSHGGPVLVAGEVQLDAQSVRLYVCASGAARISAKFVDKCGHVVGVASRDVAKAREFITSKMAATPVSVSDVGDGDVPEGCVIAYDGCVTCGMCTRWW